MNYFNDLTLPRFFCFRLVTVTVLLLLAGWNSAEAQTYPFREYGVLDGMPQGEYPWTIQDSRGYFWLKSSVSLFRFDGTEFIDYSRTDSIYKYSHLFFFEDMKHTIWLLNNDGLAKFTGDGFSYFHPSANLKIKKFEGACLMPCDSNNNFYLVCSKEGSSKNSIVTFREGAFSDYSARFPTLDSMNIYFTFYDAAADVLMIQSDEVHLWSWKDSTLKLLTNNFHGFQKGAGNVLYRIDHKYYEYKNSSLTPVNDPFYIDRSLVRIKDNLGKRDSLEYFAGNSLIRLETTRQPFYGFLDRENCLWLNYLTGMGVLSSTAFSSIELNKTGLNSVWAVACDKRRHIWLGSLFGGNLLEYDGKVFKQRNEFKKVMPESTVFFKGSRTMKNGDIWFSTSTGVLVWNGKKFSRLKGISDFAQVCYIYEDPDNNLVMIGTDKGLYIIKEGASHLLKEFSEEQSGVIEGITKDDLGMYWLSGHKGILKFDGINSTRIRQDILPNEDTYTIEKDSHGGIWLTSTSGLFFKNRNSETFIDGLPFDINSGANSIIVMDSSHILVGRTRDICIIDLMKFYSNRKDYYRLYDKSDGYTGSDCLDDGIIKDKSGCFWILTSERLVKFDPSRLRKNITPPIMHLTGLFYRNDSLNWISVEKSGFFYSIPENIVLKSDQHSIRITYNGISTTNPAKVTYRYFLEGYDKKWSLPTVRREKTFEKLPPGHYTFMLKATNADGVESPEPLILHFIIRPSFWQTKIFIIVAIVLSLTSVVLVPIYFVRRKQIRKEQNARLLSELSQLQMKIVIRQFDPHFTFNVISSVGTLILKEQPEIAYEYIIKLAALLRTVLNDGSPVIKPLTEELDFVRQYCELTKLRFKERFSFEIIVDDAVNQNRPIPKMLIQTFVENSIKHGFENLDHGGHVEVSASKNEENLLLVIRDNGVGRDHAAKSKTVGTGHGMKIIKAMLAEMNNGNEKTTEIEIIDLADSGIPSGTEVRILIPDDYLFMIRKKRYEKKYRIV